MTRRWWFWVVGAVVIAVVAAGATWWVQWRSDPLAGSVSVDVEPSRYTFGQEGGSDWLSATVTNESGRKLTDAEVRFSVTDPGGDFPRVTFSDQMYGSECSIEDGRSPDECEALKKRMRSQSCQREQVGDDNKRGVVCDGDLPKDAGDYDFAYGIGGVLSYDEWAAFEKYPDLTIRAEVLVAGERVATDKQRLNAGLVEGYGQLAVDDLPTGMAVDDPASRQHDWSITVTNDSDTGIDDAKLVVELESNVWLAEIGATGDGCGPQDPDARFRIAIVCSNMDVPAGRSVTVEMLMHVADGAAARLAQLCPADSSMEDKCRATTGDMRLKITMTLGDRTYAHLEDTVKLRTGD